MSWQAEPLVVCCVRHRYNLIVDAGGWSCHAKQTHYR